MCFFYGEMLLPDGKTPPVQKNRFYVTIKEEAAFPVVSKPNLGSKGPSKKMGLLALVAEWFLC